MKTEDLPQDKSALSNFTKEVCYVKNKEGKYETKLSIGWEVKTAALDSAWAEVKRRIESARKDVIEGKKSPINYYMEKKLMDINILSAYTGFWKLNIKRHLKPTVFIGLSLKKLTRYAEVFEISVQELKNFKG